VRLLEKYGCDLDCYRDGYDNAVHDLQEIVKEGAVLEGPLEEVAKALVEIGNEQPVRVEPVKEYMMIFDMEHTVDGVAFETLEEAKSDAMDTYLLWIAEETAKWKCSEKGIPMPTEEEIESWDMMVENCICYVAKRDPETGEYTDTVWNATDEELHEIGWDYWEELSKESQKKADDAGGGTS